MTNLGDLEIFAKVASSGSMSYAARTLGYSPAVVSKRIMRLEARLGTRLFHRTTRIVTMTEAGEGYYRRIVMVLDGLQEAEGFVSGHAEQLQGVIKVSAPTSFGRLHVAPHISSFLEEHPGVSLNLILSDEYCDVVGDAFDLAIRIGSLGDSSLIARRLAPVRRILCASPRYLAKHGQPETFEDLQRHQCLPAHNGEPWRLEGAEGPLVFKPEANLVTNSSEVVREAAISGIGIALRSTWEVGEDLRAGKLVRVLPELEGSSDITVSAVYPSKRFLPTKVRSFIDHFSNVYGASPYWERENTNV